VGGRALPESVIGQRTRCTHALFLSLSLSHTHTHTHTHTRTLSNSLSPQVGVPRLGVLAANALNALLTADLRTIEAEVAERKVHDAAAAAAPAAAARTSAGKRSASKPPSFPSASSFLARAASLGTTPASADERTTPGGGTHAGILRDSLARLGSLLTGGASLARRESSPGLTPNSGGGGSGGAGDPAVLVTPRGGALVTPRDRSKHGPGGGPEVSRVSANGGMRALAQEAQQADVDARGQRRLIDMLSANLLRNWKEKEREAKPVVPPEHARDTTDAEYDGAHEVDARDALDNNRMVGWAHASSSLSSLATTSHPKLALQTQNTKHTRAGRVYPCRPRGRGPGRRDAHPPLLSSAQQPSDRGWAALAVARRTERGRGD
jgi:hypothetical protein